MHGIEQPFSEESLRHLLRFLPENAVLIGGQSLAFWANYYELPLSDADFGETLTKDADFLGDADVVTEVARAFPGKAVFPGKTAITALVGQVVISENNSEYLNIDVLHKIVGFDKAESVRNRASRVHVYGIPVLVMHPLDVLNSRLCNLCELRSKQTTNGIAQARLAVHVARRHISSIAKTPDETLKPALNSIEYIVKIAKSKAGRNAASRHDIHLIDALPLDEIPDENFQRFRRPRIEDELRRPEVPELVR